MPPSYYDDEATTHCFCLLQVLEQNTELDMNVSELRKTVQELEAQRDQLEHDKFSIQSSLESLESEHKIVSCIQFQTPIVRDTLKL